MHTHGSTGRNEYEPSTYLTLIEQWGVKFRPPRSWPLDARASKEIEMIFRDIETNPVGSVVLLDPQVNLCCNIFDNIPV